MLYRNIKKFQVGIGKYSSLACSNTVYITSYYEGIAYYYVMCKSGNTITTTLLNELSTTEENGVEITIKNINNLFPYYDALNYIAFFPNIYVNGSRANRFNNIKIKHYDKFACTSTTIDSKFLLGKVLYPHNPSVLSLEARAFLNNLIGTGIVIKFDIGELNITPNRESIIYTSETISKIEKRIEEVEKELSSRIKNILYKDYDNLTDYINSTKNNVFYNPIEDNIQEDYSYMCYCYYLDTTDLTNGAITYKGKNIYKERDTLNFILNTLDMPKVKGTVYGNKFYNSLPNRLYKRFRISYPEKIMLVNTPRISSVLKEYIKEKYEGYVVISDLTKEEFFRYLKEHVRTVRDEALLKYLEEEIYNEIYKNSIKLDSSKDTDFIPYKEAYKELFRKEKVITGDVILYIHSNNYYTNRYPRKFSNLSEAMHYLNGLKTGVVVANMQEDMSILSEICTLRNYTLIQAKKQVVDKIREINPSYLINTNTLYNDLFVQKLKALKLVFSEYELSELFNSTLALRPYIEKSLFDEFYKIANIASYCTKNCYCTILGRNDRIKPDEYYLSLSKKLKKYIDSITSIKTYYKTADQILIGMILVKAKVFKISNTLYQKIKSNPLINLLCRKK